MSKFYGQVFGASKTNASRRGFTDITTSAQSFDGSVITQLTYKDGTLMVRVETAEGSAICGETAFYGTFDEFVRKLKHKDLSDIYNQLYHEMCIGCPKEKICHEECTNCDEFMERFDALGGEIDG